MDKGLKALANSMLNLKSLTFLNLDFSVNNNFTDEGIKTLANTFLNLNNLQVLKLNLG